MKIVLENVTKQFPPAKSGGEGVKAVRNFSFEFPDGALIGLLGPSGCGKSTTLHLISGLQKPTAGKIYFGEDDVTEVAAENRGVGLVFQNYALYPHLSVLGNITFPLENFKGEAKLTRAEREQRAREAARLVEIEHLLDRKPGALSGGQQQRVAIARAIVKEPRVLLLDEPLSNLDARLRLATREELRRIQRATGVTTVFVTHDQEEAMSISDLIIVMRDGVVQQTGEPQSVYDDPKNLFVAKFLGTPPINVFSAEIRSGELYIGGEKIMSVRGAPDGEVYAAIRPEGFIPSVRGSFRSDFLSLEVMGRDVTVISDSPASLSGDIRSIISSDERFFFTSPIATFDIKPTKLFLFDTESEERIYFEIPNGKEEKPQEALD